MNISAYRHLLVKLGFTDSQRGKRLRHAVHIPSLYFNWKRDSEVYFTGYLADRACYATEPWQELPPQQKKDGVALWVTLLPMKGFEERAFIDFLARSTACVGVEKAKPEFPSPPESRSDPPVIAQAGQPQADAVGLFSRSVASIETAYAEMGHTLGWRFLTGSRSTLASACQVGFISLNPGGDRESPDHPRASCESGNAYLAETWPGCAPGSAPLQRQVQMLFAELASRLGKHRSLQDFVTTRVMSAYFIPFRSPSFAALPRRKESLEFARGLWSSILERWTPPLIITIDTETFKAIHAMLLNRPGVAAADSRLFPSGWGGIQLEAIRLSGVRAAGPVTVARLPHLSRFRLFGNSARVPDLCTFLDYVTTYS